MVYLSSLSFLFEYGATKKVVIEVRIYTKMEIIKRGFKSTIEEIPELFKAVIPFSPDKFPIPITIPIKRETGREIKSTFGIKKRTNLKRSASVKDVEKRSLENLLNWITNTKKKITKKDEAIDGKTSMKISL